VKDGKRKRERERERERERDTMMRKRKRKRPHLSILPDPTILLKERITTLDIQSVPDIESELKETAYTRCSRMKADER